MPIDNGKGYYFQDYSQEFARMERDRRISKTLDVLGWITWAVACISAGVILGLILAMAGR